MPVVRTYFLAGFFGLPLSAAAFGCCVRAPFFWAEDDDTKPVTSTGVVTKLDWENPPP
jgi:hypothetical protein